MSKKPSSDLILSPDAIQNMVRVVRGQRVMLDFDFAWLYGVTTTRLNERSTATEIGSLRISPISLHSKSLRV